MSAVPITALAIRVAATIIVSLIVGFLASLVLFGPGWGILAAAPINAAGYTAAAWWQHRRARRWSQ